MDLGIILWAATFGAIGGVAGGLISSFLPEKIRTFSIPALVVVAVIISRLVSPAQVSDTTGQAWVVDLYGASDSAQSFDDMITHLESPEGDIIRMVREHEPEYYATLEEQAATHSESGTANSEIIDITRTNIAEFLSTKTPELSDEELAIYTRLAREQFQSLIEDHEDYCMSAARGQDLGIIDLDTLPVRYAEIEVEATRLVLESELPGGETLSREEWGPYVSEAAGNTISEFGELGQQVFQSLSDPDMQPPEGGCAVWVYNLMQIEAVEMPLRAHIWRTLLSN